MGTVAHRARDPTTAGRHPGPTYGLRLAPEQPRPAGPTAGRRTLPQNLAGLTFRAEFAIYILYTRPFPSFAG